MVICIVTVVNIVIPPNHDRGILHIVYRFS